ncbi:MAG TPA: alpha/beta hydrolase [bacterium]|nr:alpha/beta hydrolase [bacterium]HQG44847.1 alpha/beta hydrolase [bacterium]HQJ65259.1 alpha/beta hydrolase [bacterium]
MKSGLITFIWILALSFPAGAQEIIDLYPGAVPNTKASAVTETGNDQPAGIISGVTKPTLEIYLPDKDKATGAAVIICPGGGYQVIVYQSEGVKTAIEFAKNGVAAFVLKYRIPDDATMQDKKIGPLQDAQQAIKLVRENAAKWGIEQVGIMGFSAGGHLASTAATHFDRVVINNDAKVNLRPDFMILVYPVISMQDSLTHLDSRKNLLGDNPSPEIIGQFSNELQVNENTPPAYITHAGDDQLVDVDNSIVFYEKLRHCRVPAELHIYPHGGHGFVLFQQPADWMPSIFKWMKNSKLWR